MATAQQQKTFPSASLRHRRSFAKHEFDAGVEHLRKFGFDPRIESQVAEDNFIFPGADDARAEAIYRLALDPTIPILWAARGGYGAGRLLPLLEKLTNERGAPKQKKLLIGYSDVTVCTNSSARAGTGAPCTLPCPPHPILQNSTSANGRRSSTTRKANPPRRPGSTRHFAG
jgi:muramoyltetrapeptide carboxypeptidase LdcA involved in peptidoglycan recycling